MNSLAELDHLHLDPTAKAQVMALVQVLLDQAKHEATVQLHAKNAELQAKSNELQAKDAEIKRKDFKIEALTFELAQIKRLRYGVKSEALSPLQRDIFEDTLNTDLAAIEAELEQLTAAQSGTSVAKAQRPRAGRKMLLHFLHSPHPCGLPSAVTGSSAAY